MSAAESSNAGPGAWLAAAREQAGWSLVQAAERLHLDVAAIKALESDDYRSFGAPVYARGHLRRYAELVGLQPHEVDKAFFRTHSDSSAPDLRRGAGLLQKSDAGAGALRPATAAIAAVILVIIALIWWAMRMPHAAPPTAPADAGRAAANAPLPDAPTDPTHH